jgi:hypothetical protein
LPDGKEDRGDIRRIRPGIRCAIIFKADYEAAAIVVAHGHAGFGDLRLTLWRIWVDPLLQLEPKRFSCRGKKVSNVLIGFSHPWESP